MAAGLALGTAFTAAAALAATGPDMTGAAVGRDVDGAAAAATVAQQAAAAAGRTAQKEPTFDILEYRVVGNSKLPVIQVEEAVYPFLGEGKSRKDADGAAAALQKAYQKAGFLTVLVDVPAQEVTGGVVTLRVVEGTVGRVRVTGARYFSPSAIKEAAPSIAPGEVPYFPDVQKDLVTLNRSQDLRVAPVLKPGATPGTVDVELKANDDLPVHGDISLNNRSSANTQPLRLQGSLRYDNLWSANHSFGLQFQTAPQDTHQVRLLSGTYLMPADADRMLAIYGVYSRSAVAAAGDLTVLGNTDILGLRYIMPIKGSENWYHSATLGIDYKRSADITPGVGVTPLHYAPLFAQYSATAKDRIGSTQFGLSTSIGIPRLLGADDFEFSQKRFQASPGFMALRGEISRNQAISGPWSFYGKFDAQYASGPLVNSEQFSVGGAESVRGYKEAEALGDYGVHLTMELRDALPYGWLRVPVSEFYWLAFFDMGAVQTKEALPSERAGTTLASAGVGIRVKMLKTVRLALDVAYPIRDGAFSLTDGSVTHAGDIHTHFHVGYEF